MSINDRLYEFLIQQERGGWEMKRWPLAADRLLQDDIEVLCVAWDFSGPVPTPPLLVFPKHTLGNFTWQERDDARWCAHRVRLAIGRNPDAFDEVWLEDQPMPNARSIALHGRGALASGSMQKAWCVPVDWPEPSRFHFGDLLTRAVLSLPGARHE